MSIPTPKPGLVIRYSFLWGSEHDAGAIEGKKDRPCAIVVAVPQDAGKIRTIVAPITHTPPIDPTTSLEIPANVCKNLGLDGGRHWIRFDELNHFIWPGYDLRQKTDGNYQYGMLPRGLYEELRNGIVAIQKMRQAQIVTRDD